MLQPLRNKAASTRRASVISPARTAPILQNIKAVADEGRLTLVFQDNPMELRQWLVVDAQARETRVSLSRIETGIRIDPRIFEFNDPRFFENDQGRGPPGGG